MVKKTLYIVLACLFCSCELIKEEDRLIPLPKENRGAARTHVLIEFTGFRCVNCPTASELAQDLKQIYDSQLIVVAMHPASNPFTQGAAKYDYTCPEAEQYYRLCGGTAQTPFPKGNIDLQPVEGNYLLSPSDWGAQLHRMASDSTTISMELSASIDTTTRVLTVHADVEGDTAIAYKTTYWLVEDSVLGAQMMPDGSANIQYYHRRMLRTALSDTVPYTLPETYRASHCAIVAIIQDKDQHILQAKQTHIKPL